MPDQSCRRCGDELRVRETCPECKSPTSFICPACEYEPDKRFHSYCIGSKKQWMVITV